MSVVLQLYPDTTSQRLRGTVGTRFAACCLHLFCTRPAWRSANLQPFLPSYDCCCGCHAEPCILPCYKYHRTFLIITVTLCLWWLLFLYRLLFISSVWLLFSLPLNGICRIVLVLVARLYLRVIYLRSSGPLYFFHMAYNAFAGALLLLRLRRYAGTYRAPCERATLARFTRVLVLPNAQTA